MFVFPNVGERLHFLIVVEVEVEVVGWKVADLNLVWTDKAAEIRLAREVAFPSHAVPSQSREDRCRG